MENTAVFTTSSVADYRQRESTGAAEKAQGLDPYKSAYSNWPIAEKCL
jgi:hypothetical protein